MSDQVNVFICYAKEDRKIARRLYDALKKAGVSPWMDEVDIRPGQNWKNEIHSAIKRSSYFLALISSNSVLKKGFVQKELKMALEILDEMPPSEIFILPIRLDDCNPLDGRLEDIQWINIFSPYYEDGLKQILDVLVGTKPDSNGLKLTVSRIIQNKKATLDYYGFKKDETSKLKIPFMFLLGSWVLFIATIAFFFGAFVFFQKYFDTSLIESKKKALEQGQVLNADRQAVLKKQAIEEPSKKAEESLKANEEDLKKATEKLAATEKLEAREKKAKESSINAINQLKGIETKKIEGGLTIIVKANQPITDFHPSDSLLKEQRTFYIDFPGNWKEPKKKSYEIENDIVKNIRIGSRPNSIRSYALGF